MATPWQQRTSAESDTSLRPFVCTCVAAHTDRGCPKATWGSARDAVLRRLCDYNHDRLASIIGPEVKNNEVFPWHVGVASSCGLNSPLVCCCDRLSNQQ